MPRKTNFGGESLRERFQKADPCGFKRKMDEIRRENEEKEGRLRIPKGSITHKED